MKFPKASGMILLPYARIGGYNMLSPLLFAKVQTIGSYTPHFQRVAALLVKPDQRAINTDIQQIHAESSTETEWASISLGMKLALRHGEGEIAVENDNLCVIRSLILFKAPLKHDYARYYRDEILQLSKHTEWTGVRWIPREINMADTLFR